MSSLPHRDQPAAAVPAALLHAIVARLHPRRVILFGSHAQGRADAGSDLDLLVLLDDDAPADHLSWRAAYEARQGHHEPVDILLCRAGAFDRDKAVIGSVAYEIAQDGVTVYERR